MPSTVYNISNGMLAASIAAHGATILAIHTPDRKGVLENIVVGGLPRAGATIGRYANRIANARFTLDGTVYELSANDGANTLHGGKTGFDSAVWKLVETAEDRITLSHSSPNGDQGFPGKLQVAVTFALSHDALRIDYLAQSTRDTVVNFTNHTYFNLSADGSPVDNQALQIFASSRTPLDADLIPTGAIENVEGTRYDFRSPRTIGAQPYDMNWVIDRSGTGLEPAAICGDPRSGRVIEVLTTQPGLQVYTGQPGGIALETQHFADSPNHAQFPTTALRAHERFSSSTVYRFSASAPSAI